ncbi:MAG: glycosyltransferase [Acidobacteriota bacterium]
MPLVSVIMPAYNVEPFIDAAIASVRVQTFRDFELLVVDDGSTDGTAAVAERHVREDPRVRLMGQVNAGISGARNLALRHARGSLIAILDSDDAWVPGYLEAQLRVLEQRPDVDIVIGNAWFHGGPQDGRPASPTPDPRADPDLRSLLEDETSVFIMTVFRREVTDTLGGFDESFRCNEDYDLWIRAALAGFRFTRNDTPAGYYRRREDSLSANELRMLTGILRVYAKTRPALANRPEELAVLDRQVRRFETEQVAALARQALQAGDHAGIERWVTDLHHRRGGLLLLAARLAARRFPGLLTRAYQVHRFRLRHI